MFNIGGGELLLILLLALIVLGPQKLPEAARTVGRVVRELQRLSSGFQREFQKAIEDDDPNNADTRRATTTRPEAVPLASVIGDLDADDETDNTSNDGTEPDRNTGEPTPAATTPTGADGNGNGANASGSNGADTKGHRRSVTGEGDAAIGDDTVADEVGQPIGDDTVADEVGQAIGDDTVADEVGQALDEIVATSSPPSGPETDRAADTATDDAVSPAHDAPAQADDPDGGDRR